MAGFLFTMVPANDLGLPTRLVPIARALADRGHDVAVFNPSPAPAKLIADAGALTQHCPKEHSQKSRIVSGARSDFICATDGAAIPAGESCDNAGGASEIGSGYECATRSFSHSQMIPIDGPVYKGRSIVRQRSL